MSQRKVISAKTWPWYDTTRYSFCMAVQKEDYLYLSGNTASEFDPASKTMVCKGDIVDQAKVNYEKIKLIMEGAGGSMDDIIKMVDYVTPAGVDKYPKLDELRRKYFKENHPAGTSFVVNRLLRPDAYLEVECVAVLGKAKKTIIKPSGWVDVGVNNYQPAVMKGDLLMISGQTGIDHTTGKLVSNDVVAQAEQAYKNIKQLLDAVGATFDDVVKTWYYIAPSGYFKYDDIVKVRAQYFKNSFPAHTAVITHQLLPIEATIKIDCVAVVGKSKKEMFDLGLTKQYSGLTYRPVVRKGALVYLSGVTSTDMATGRLVPGTIIDQQRQILINAEKMLKAAGLGWGDLMMTVDFIQPESEPGYRGTAKVRHEFFKGELPPSTGVIQYKIMGPEGAQMNVDFTAAV
jgi:enamine deaminase RidA (YjgF/YER057c/UK114 family)